jgi:ACS family hexuronate transporter-like MFS transporter
MGNSVLQSGTSVGAIVTPLIMNALLSSRLESWRMPFQLVGVAGLAWVVLWFTMVHAGDLDSGLVSPRAETTPQTDSSSVPWRIFFSRRMLVLFFVVACINTCWQTLRAWLPKFLQQGRGYVESDALYFNSVFYVATDVGCLGAGALTLFLARRGWAVHASRSAVFLGCAILGALTIVAAMLPKGWLLLAVLLLVGAGTLGLFPIYHAFTQELSAGHQGKVTGITGVAAWVFSSPAQKLFGRLIDHTGSFDLGLAVVGCLPLAAFVALWLFWQTPPARAEVAPAGATTRA